MSNTDGQLATTSGKCHRHTRVGQNLLHDAHLIENEKDFHSKADKALDRIKKRRLYNAKILGPQKTIWDIAEEKLDWIKEQLDITSYYTDDVSVAWTKWAKKRIAELNEELSLFSTK